MLSHSYAHFSVKHPWGHRTILLIVLVVFLISCYQLLSNENLVYGLGCLFAFLAILLFSRASDFKRKYLGHE